MAIFENYDEIINHKPAYPFDAVQGEENLLKANSNTTNHKCSFPNHITIKPDGVNELDACIYCLAEEHKNVTVKVWRCAECGNIDISWERQENTETTIYDDETEE